MKNPYIKGYLIALAAAFTATNTYFASKHLLSANSILQFGILWYGFGLLFNSVYLVVTGKIKDLSRLSAKSIMVLLIFSVLEIISTTSFFLAISYTENPAIVSFLGNITPMLVTILGIIFLKERFNKFEVLGIIVAISGAFLVCYQPTMSIYQFLASGSGLVILSSLVISVTTILTKKFILRIEPYLFSFSRVFALFFFTVIMMFVLSEPFSFTAESVLVSMYGAFIGPFVGAFAVYYSIKFIPASKAVIIQSFKSVIILVFAYFLLGLWPLWVQVAGGLLTVAGIILITAFRNNGK